ncbi:RDD family protein [uncultured Helicobacter sp.]|uniref:RDD family protein n=1 Tax=uncultured Helicobacter sp. TaxID=175537 RepID=UPI00374E3C1B
METKIAQLLEREGLTLASIQTRILAYVLDVCIISVAVSFLFWEELLAVQIKLDSGNVPKDMMIELLLWVFAFCMVYEMVFSMLYGATLGKVVMKIRIISIDFADKPSFLQSFVRALLKYIGSNIFYLSYLPAFDDEFRRALHDKIPKTLVISN